MKHQAIRLLAVLAMLILGPSPADAADYPARTVRIIVPFAVGGPSDFQARLLAQKLTEDLKQPFIVENRAGASGNIGVELAVKSPADGYVLLFCSTGPLVVNPALFDHLPFDAQKDLTPIALLSTAPSVIAVNPQSPIKSFADLLRLARSSSEKLSYASGGEGTTQHLAGELLRTTANLQLTHVAYRGEGPATNDVLAGHVPIILMSIGTGMPYLQSGRLRPLAVTSAARSASLPDVPSVAESGLVGYEVVAWQGVFAPAGTPRNIVEKLNLYVNRILKDPEFRDRLSSTGNAPGGGTPEDMANFVQSEFPKWARLVSISGAKASN